MIEPRLLRKHLEKWQISLVNLVAAGGESSEKKLNETRTSLFRDSWGIIPNQKSKPSYSRWILLFGWKEQKVLQPILYDRRGSAGI